MKTDLVIGAYIVHESKVLLVYHKKLKMWLPVGGHIEQNETPEEAVIREVKEEVNMEIEFLNKTKFKITGTTKKVHALPFCVNTHSVGDHDHCCFFYVCKSKNQELDLEKKELDDFKWFSTKDLESNEVSLEVKEMALEAINLTNLSE